MSLKNEENRILVFLKSKGLENVPKVTERQGEFVGEGV